MTVLFLLVLQILSPAPSALPETLQINGIVREPADAWSDDPSSSLGPVLAIFGSHAVTDYRPVAGDPLELPGALLETEFASPIWPGPSAEGAEASYRLRPPQAAERQVRFEYRWTSGGEIYGMDDSSCHTQSIAGLTRVACSNFVLLAEGPKLLLVSMADYGAPAADPIAELRIDGARALLVRLGLKAQTVYGLLVETADGWKARFDPRDYALLC